ncbi:MAG: hypothetical protein JWL61_2121 [Gemmatimonadetes bacterium]|nr:hypothetical protein [Gemmatimonadota bacterium]
MSWLATAPMDERLQFILDAQSDRFAMTEHCARYGVSRRVGYRAMPRRGSEDSRTGVGRRTRARTRFGPSSRICFASSDARIQTGARANCSRCSADGILSSRTGRQPRPRISSGAAGSCGSGGGGTRTSISVWCQSARRSPMISGPRTSRDNSAPGTRVLLSPHHCRSAHTLSAHLPRPAVDGDADGKTPT